MKRQTCRSPFVSRAFVRFSISTIAVAFAGACARADPGFLAPSLVNCRFNAACATIFSADGRGPSLTPLSQRPELRRQARDWLRADLGLWQRVFESNTDRHRAAVHSRMTSWLNDPHLAAIREPQRLRELHPDEQKIFELFWRDVWALHERTAPPELVPMPRVLPAPKQ
jgi:hypothetical protein